MTPLDVLAVAVICGWGYTLAKDQTKPIGSGLALLICLGSIVLAVAELVP